VTLPAREFAAAVRRTIQSHDLLRPGSAVVAGVSGGPDSMALLHALAEIAPDLDLWLVVAHLDHRLRRGSARDAGFVRMAARALRLPFVSGRRDVGRLARSRRLSIEAAGRLARYSFLFRVARARGAAAVAVGHTRDDLAETVLFRLVRGAAAGGLSGIAPSRPLDDPLAPRRGRRFAVALIRPLIERSRAEVEAYLRCRRIRPLRDPSNRSPAHARNRIRRELLPLLERRFNPAVRDALARAATALAEDDACLETLAAAALPRAGRAVSLAALRRVPLAIRRRALRLLAVRGGADPRRLVRAHYDALVRLVEAGSGSADLPGARATASSGRLAVVRARHGSSGGRDRFASRLNWTGEHG
jgi:tRNA(Ile)-lysidine synthase